MRDGEEVLNATWGPTNPLMADTDEDDLNDGDEVNTYGTNPIVKDTDGDGINDGDEVNTCEYGEDSKLCTNPTEIDSDFDGVSDSEEINTRGTDPMDNDTDDDGLEDGVELNNCIYGVDGEQCTSPLLADSDSDEIDDFTEIDNCIYGEDNDECTDPTKVDSDDDGTHDYIEINNLGVCFFSPLMHGLLVGKYSKPTKFPEGDFRENIGAFKEESVINLFQENAKKLEEKLTDHPNPVMHGVIDALIYNLKTLPGSCLCPVEP